MDSSGFLRREKYCPNGGMALSDHRGVGSPGGPTWRWWPRMGATGWRAVRPRAPSAVL